jgi:hypothetical protein
LLEECHLILTFPVCSFLAASGLIGLAKKWNLPRSACAIIIPVFLLVHGFISYQFYIYPEHRNARVQLDCVSNFASHFESNAILISDYNFGMAFWYLTQNEQNNAIVTGRPVRYYKQHPAKPITENHRLYSKFWINLANLPYFMDEPDLKALLLQNRPLYFIDHLDWPSPLVRVLQPSRLSEQSINKKSLLPRLVSYFSKKVNRELSTELRARNSLYRIYALSIMDN